MAYTERKPRAAGKTNQDGSAAPKGFIADGLVVEVVSVNPEAGNFIGRLPGTTVEATFAIAEGKRGYANKGGDSALVGNTINEAFAKEYAAGEGGVLPQVILEKVMIPGVRPKYMTPDSYQEAIESGMKAASESGKALTTDWVRTSYGEGKTLHGILSLRGQVVDHGNGLKGMRFYGVRHWAKAAIDPSDTKGMGQLNKALIKYNVEADTSEAKADQKRAAAPHIAVMARIVSADGVVIRTGEIFGYTGSRGEENRHNVTPEDVAEYVAYHQEWIKEHAPTAHMDLCVCRDYMAPIPPYHLEGVSEHPGGRGAYFVLATTQYGPDEPRHYGTVGVASATARLSPGKINPRTGKRVGSEHQRVTDVFMGGKSAPVAVMVTGPKGEHYTLSETMTVTDNRPQAKKKETPASGANADEDGGPGPR